MHLSENNEQCFKVSSQKQEFETTAFSNRVKLLEDQLSIAEKEYQKHKKNVSEEHMDVDENPHEIDNTSLNGRSKRKETRRFRGRPSIFKRPEGPAPRSTFRSVPDYHRNPHKWTKYSLDDVSNEDMTDRSNTQAALSFLKQLKARKAQEKISEKMEVDKYISNPKVMLQSMKESSSKVEYKKLNCNSGKLCGTTVIDNNDKPMFRNSKVILPEYVVGQKQKKRVKVERPSTQNNSATCIKLNHLQELDKDED